MAFTAPDLVNVKQSFRIQKVTDSSCNQSSGALKIIANLKLINKSECGHRLLSLLKKYFTLQK